ncbi:hypothetical protein PC116_g26425 [Phytophthora cactorum]|nr:hypothetical protein PC114_g24698 [Phytophthora cactorum]KAG3127801.1 hypothetical protein C6341_g24824 [Phytophthora cactorum]KAG4225133.1 hypothetical protein PC116_g26425 [Phytophthora cactorum]
MDFIFSLSPGATGRTRVLVFVDRLSKMDNLVRVAGWITADEFAAHIVDFVFRHYRLPKSIVSDRDPRFTTAL